MEKFCSLQARKFARMRIDFSSTSVLVSNFKPRAIFLFRRFDPNERADFFTLRFLEDGVSRKISQFSMIFTFSVFLIAMAVFEDKVSSLFEVGTLISCENQWE